MGVKLNLSEDEIENAQELSESLRGKANEHYIGVSKTRDYLAQVRHEILDLSIRDVIEVDSSDDYTESRTEAKMAIIDCLKGNIPHNQEEFKMAKEGALVKYLDLIENSYESRRHQDGHEHIELLGLDYLSND